MLVYLINRKINVTQLRLPGQLVCRAANQRALNHNIATPISNLGINHVAAVAGSKEIRIAIIIVMVYSINVFYLFKKMFSTFNLFAFLNALKNVSYVLVILLVRPVRASKSIYTMPG